MKKKKVKIPLSLIFTTWLYPKVETVFPWLAKRWFIKIFFSTARFNLPTSEIEILSEAKKPSLKFEGKKIQLYEWGEGQPVLFVHGWMGRASQFWKFIPIFNKAGYKVVSFDSTGHGFSAGKKSHLLEFAAIIQMLKERYGKFKMIAGHSLGGVASLHAVKDHGVTDRLIMLASPAIAQEIVEEFRKKIGASRKSEPYFQQYFVDTYGKRFEEYSASHIISDVKGIDLMLVYDENDREVSMRNPAILKEKYPEAKLITTEGLGNNRILKDEGVIKSALEFLEDHQEEATTTS